jgi:hypothetical protein
MRYASALDRMQPVLALIPFRCCNRATERHVERRASARPLKLELGRFVITLGA